MLLIYIIVYILLLLFAHDLFQLPMVYERTGDEFQCGRACRYRYDG